MSSHPQEPAKTPHCLTKTKQLPKMPFKVLHALFLKTVPPHSCHSSSHSVSLYFYQVCPQPSELAHDLQSFSSVLCFLLYFMKTSASYSCLAMKTYLISCPARSFAFSSSPPLVSLAAAEYSILLALANFISSSSIHFKVLKDKDHVLFIFLSFLTSTMPCSKIMLNTCKEKKMK